MTAEKKLIKAIREYLKTKPDILETKRFDLEMIIKYLEILVNGKRSM
jgi:uncharacterized protein (DUF2164 family)